MSSENEQILLPPLSESSKALLVLVNVMQSRPVKGSSSVLSEWENKRKNTEEKAMEVGASRFDILNIEFHHLSAAERQTAFESEREERFPGLTHEEIMRLVQNHNLK